MKKKFCFIILMLVAYHTSAQDFPLFDIGVKAGVNGSFIRDFTNYDGMQIGFVGGIWGRVKLPLLGLYVQPELVFSQTGGKYTAPFQIGPGDIIQSSFDTRLSNLDAVLLFGQRFGLGPLALRLNLGPVFSTILSAKDEADVAGVTMETDLDDFVDKSQVGLQFGVGVDISKFNIDLRYQHNFSRLFELNQDPKISALQLTLGYKIL